MTHYFKGILLFHRVNEVILNQVSMATKMATVDKAKELLEKLRSASWDAAVQGEIFI